MILIALIMAFDFLEYSSFKGVSIDLVWPDAFVRSFDREKNSH